MPVPSTLAAAADCAEFTEAPAWEKVGAGWRPLQGNFGELGYSVEWHDFSNEEDLDWSPSFHRDGVEICLNLAGRGEVQAGNAGLELRPRSAGFYLQGRSSLTGLRPAGTSHRFITVELSFDFLAQNLGPAETKFLHPAVRAVLAGKASARVSEPLPLTHDLQQVAQSLREPPVPAGARALWYRAKALEVASTVLYDPAGGGDELFCHRCQRLNRERAQRVIAILKENISEPLSLEEIGRRVGCSPHYLSRIFSQEMGRGIFQCLRDLRMERAAQLLREKRLNVTEVALEVGYSSPSHFSVAFHTAFGCCPGLYPLKTLG